MSETNKQVVRKFLQAMSDGDPVAADECLAPGAVAVTMGTIKFSRSSSRELVLEMIGAMKSLLPNGMGITIKRLFAEGDDVAAEFVGNAMTSEGTRYDNQYCMLFTLENGRISLTHEYFCTKLAEEVLWPIVAKSTLADAIEG